MKICGYCGKESEVDALCCAECGTAFPSVEAAGVGASSAPVSQEAKGPTLGAKAATMILLAYLAAQFTVGGLVGMVAGIASEIQHRASGQPTDSAKLKEEIISATVIPAMVGGGLVMLCVSVLVLHGQLRDSSPTGAAWVTGSSKHVAQGLLAGMLAGCCYAAVAMALGPRHGHTPMGPVARMAMTPGLPRVLWMFAVLALAPLIEELLFRGVLYGGYRRSFGPRGAALFTTFIFWLLHITESIHFLPAMLAIAMLALLALWFRLRSAAIGPAIAVHFGYNSMLALVVILSAFASPHQKGRNARTEISILSTKPDRPGGFQR